MYTSSKTHLFLSNSNTHFISRDWMRLVYLSFSPEPGRFFWVYEFPDLLVSRNDDLFSAEKRKKFVKTFLVVLFSWQWKAEVRRIKSGRSKKGETLCTLKLEKENKFSLEKGKMNYWADDGRARYILCCVPILTWNPSIMKLRNLSNKSE